MKNNEKQEAAMHVLSVREMRNQLGRLDELLAREKEVIVTRRNRPVARILPIRGKKKKPDHARLRADLPFQEVGSEVLLRMDRKER